MGLPIATMLIPTPAGTPGQAGVSPQGAVGVGGIPGAAGVTLGIAGQIFPNLLLTGIAPTLLQDIGQQADAGTSVQPQEDFQTLLALYQPGQFAQPQQNNQNALPVPGQQPQQNPNLTAQQNPQPQILAFGQSDFVVTPLAEPVAQDATAQPAAQVAQAAPESDGIEQFLKLVSSVVSTVTDDAPENAANPLAETQAQSQAAKPAQAPQTLPQVQTEEFALQPEGEQPQADAAAAEKPILKAVQAQQVIQAQAPAAPVAQDVKPEADKRDAKDIKGKPAILLGNDTLNTQIQNNARPVAAIVNEALGQRDLVSGGHAKDAGVLPAQSNPVDIANSILNGQSPLGADAARGNPHSMDATFSRMMQTTAHHPPVFDQVVVHIKNAIEQGASKINIKLEPAELGKVEIRMEVMSDGRTGLVVTADNKDALDLLQRDARHLAQALNDAGLKTDSGSLSFNLRQQHQQPQQNNDFSYGAPSIPGMPQINESMMPAVQYTLSVTSGLDITV